MKLKNLLSKTILLAVLVTCSFVAKAQDYMTRNGHVSFFSKTPAEDIDAENYQVGSMLNSKTGEVIFSVPIKSFEFKKALMQEHFNEKYLESDKFPKATFKGKITDLAKVNFSKDGTYTADVEGDLTMHGVTKKVNAKGTFVVKGSDVDGKGTFQVKPEDYNIEIPGVVREKIAKSLDVHIDMNYKPKK